MPRLLPVADTALLVDLSDAGAAAGQHVAALDEALAARTVEGLLDRIPGLTTLLVEYDPLRTDAAAVSQVLAPLVDALALAASGPARRAGRSHRLPVCFDADLAPDLDSVAACAGTDAGGVCRLLCGAPLRVALMGHLPGFPYLSGVPAALHLPRRADPRTAVPAGAVALAGGLAGIYPVSAPGGWHLVGRTAARLYDPERADPFLLRPGDAVHLEAVDRAAFERLAAAGEQR